jgi:hypothetical protein
MMAGVLFIPTGQAFTMLGLNMYPMRCLELVGFVRVIVRKEFSTTMVNGIDRAVLMVYTYSTIVFLLRTALGGGTSESITQLTTLAKIALLVDVVLCYLTFRGLIGSLGDLVWFLRAFVPLLVPFVALLAIESRTGNNPFFIMGGGFSTTWNDGVRIRCNGSFGHPSLLGTLGASFLPLYIGLALTKATRVRALVGIALCMAVVLIANSSGPVIFMVMVGAAWVLWIMRRKMSVVRRGIVGVFVLLAMVMKMPVWYLPMKLTPTVGGDGWHRSELMDKGFQHIDQWWLVGMPLDLTVDWFPYRAKGAVDLTNVYLAFGFDGGILAIALLILLIVRAFRSLGLTLATVRRSSRVAGQREFLLWGLGTVLVGHIANFISIGYWDQTYAIWFMQIATISGVTAGYNALTHRQDARLFIPRPRYWQWYLNCTRVPSSGGIGYVPRINARATVGRDELPMREA